MYFGEFLLEKKMITADQLLDALVYQIERIPSFLQVIREDGKLSSVEIIDLIKIQLENNSDLVTVLRDKKIYADVEIELLYKKQFKNRPMLGEILVDQQILAVDRLESLLLEFLSNKENLEIIKQRAENLTAPVETKKDKHSTAKESSLSEAALESLRELGISTDGLMTSAVSETKKKPEGLISDVRINIGENSIFITEFLNVFDEKLNGKLRKLFEIIHRATREKADISNYYNSLYRVLHLINGVALAADLNDVTEMLFVWEKVLEENFAMSKEDLAKWSSLNISNLDETLNLLWKMRSDIATGLNVGVIIFDSEVVSIKNRLIQSYS